ncbi:hypothetical protein N0V82_003024 [Gnomoniopsis sp. IMI 355080]|nr:hypothetical protein N0V82_003024 [Gnomoniopsis sp. IMI 355080]
MSHLGDDEAVSNAETPKQNGQRARLDRFTSPVVRLRDKLFQRKARTGSPFKISPGPSTSTTTVISEGHTLDDAGSRTDENSPPPRNGQHKPDLCLPAFRELCNGLEVFIDDLYDPQFSLDDSSKEILELIELDYSAQESPAFVQWLDFRQSTGITNQYLDRVMAFPGREDVKEVFLEMLKRAIMYNAHCHSGDMNGVLDHLPNVDNDSSKAQTILIMHGDFPKIKQSSSYKVCPDPDPLPTIRLQGFNTKQFIAMAKAELRRRSHSSMRFDSGITDEVWLDFVKETPSWHAQQHLQLTPNLDCIKEGAHDALRRQRNRIRSERLSAVADPVMKLNDSIMTKEDLQSQRSPQADATQTSPWKEIERMIGPTMHDFRELIVRMIQLHNQGPLQGTDALQVFDRLFIGPPGCGKSTAARLYGQILSDLGLFGRNVKVVSAITLTSSRTGGAESKMREVLEELQNDVLVLDDVHMIDDGWDDESHERSCGAMIEVLVAHKKMTRRGSGGCIILVGDEGGLEELYQKDKAGLNVAFPLETAIRFIDLEEEELRQLLQRTVIERRITVDDAAIDAGVKALVRAKSKPTFGNGSAVRDLVTNALLRCYQRTSDENRGSIEDLTPSRKPSALQPIDFDPSHGRLNDSTARLASLFEGFVDFGSIVTTFQDYAYTAAGMQLRGVDPRLYLPFTFVFKGPPGTGKTSSARKLGQIYFDLGILSSPDVVECSASNLVGQYVGSTAPLLLRQMKKGLGKVLFIDEAYRLAPDKRLRTYNDEAVGELIDALTKPRFARKLVIVLAGYTKEMNKLLGSNPGFQSRFSTEIEFSSLSPTGCLAHLQHCMAKVGIEIEGIREQESIVSEETLSAHKRVETLLTKLSVCKNWASARSIEKIAQIMIGQVFRKCALENNVTGSLRVTLMQLEAVLDETLRVTMKQGRV